MRVTKEILLKLAKDFVDQRSRSDRTLLGIFLQGALLEDEPFLGGITDIDLFLVHSEAVPQEREIVRVSDEIHLDLVHHSRSQYRQTRELRQQAWLGNCINGGKILFDPQHFLDFTQASVRGQFHRPDHVLIRSRALLDQARQIWVGLWSGSTPVPGPLELAKFFQVIEHAVNAVAGLSGPPLTERRLLQRFPARAAAVQHPGLATGLMGLLGGTQLDAGMLRGWLPAWQADYSALATEEAPAQLHPHRFPYYLRGIEGLLESPRPQDALWPLMSTWLAVVCRLADAAAREGGWQDAVGHLGLLGGGFSGRLEALDAYLDTIDELLEGWGSAHGA